MSALNKDSGEQYSPEVLKKKKENDKALSKFLTSLNKRLTSDKDSEGDEVMTGSESLIPATPIPTGFPAFDEATGIGGMPNNGVVEVSGDEGIGKTWFALKTMASAQKINPTRRVVHFDLEGSSDPERLKYAGINLDELLMPPPNMSGEAIFETIEEMVESGLFSVILLDSIPALQPRKIFEGAIGDQHYGPIAALLSDALRKIAPKCRKHNVLLIMINQVRQNIGAGPFEPQTVTTGGKAIKFYSHMRIQLKKFYEKGSKLKFQITDSTGEIIGHRVTAKFIKNRYGPPFKEGMYEVFYKDPDTVFEVIKLAKKAKLWRIYKGDHTYVDLKGNKIIAPDEDTFRRRLMMGYLVTEMAQRILLMQAQGEIEEELLDAEFDIEALKEMEKSQALDIDFSFSNKDEIEIEK